MGHRLRVFAVWGLALLLAAAGIMSIVSCGGPAGTESDSNSSSLRSGSGTTAGANGKDSPDMAVFQYREKEVPLDFSWWGNDVRHIYTLKGIDLFQKQNPEILVNYKFGVWDGYELKNRVRMNSGTNADVMQINFNWLEEYSADGTGYYDLNKLKDQIDLSGYTSEDLKVGQRQDKLNAIPIAYNSTVFFYNKTIYDKYDLPIPETWDDLFAAAARMRDDGIYPLGVVKKHLFQCLMAYYEQTTGRVMFNDTGFRMYKEDVEYVLEFIKKLVDEKVIPLTDDFSAEDFTTGKVAGVGCWNSDASRYCEGLSNRGENIVIGVNIGSENGSKRYGWYIKPATMYAISAGTEHPKEAAALLNFLVNDKEMILLQGTEKGVPVNRNARTILKEANKLRGFEYKANVSMMSNRERMGVMIPLMENATVVDTFKKMGDEYIFGRMSLSDCADQILETVHEVVAEG